MHGQYKIRFINAQQTNKQTYKYKNINEKLYKCNATICYITNHADKKQLTRKK